MGILIDSSVVIAGERGDLDLEPYLRDRGSEEVAIAAITASELLHGVHRMKGVKRARSEALVERWLATLPTIAFDLDVARVHATIAADLRSRGTPVGAHDLQIGATAVFLDYDVATRDLRSFPRIRGLRVLHW
jgi:tRNA(fMet)-specific endonuclease VapC